MVCKAKWEPNGMNATSNDNTNANERSSSQNDGVWLLKLIKSTAYQDWCHNTISIKNFQSNRFFHHSKDKSITAASHHFHFDAHSRERFNASTDGEVVCYWWKSILSDFSPTSNSFNVCKNLSGTDWHIHYNRITAFFKVLVVVRISPPPTAHYIARGQYILPSTYFLVIWLVLILLLCCCTM